MPINSCRVLFVGKALQAPITVLLARLPLWFILRQGHREGHAYAKPVKTAPSLASTSENGLHTHCPWDGGGEDRGTRGIVSPPEVLARFNALWALVDPMQSRRVLIGAPARPPDNRPGPCPA